MIDRFRRGSSPDGHARIKLLKLSWDAVETQFGARHGRCEINHSATQEQTRVDMAQFSGGRDREAVVDRRISDYDLEGQGDAAWTEAH